MRIDTSYGIIPLRKREGDWEVFLVQLHQGHWGFPKGHADSPKEKPKEAACRELLEETGLRVEKYLSELSLQETYMFMFQKELIKKTVHYFLAEVIGEIYLQAEEIADGKWVSVAKASDHLTFSEGKKMLQKVSDMLLGCIP